MLRRLRHRIRRPDRAIITGLADRTTIDPATGVVRSIQTADLRVAADELDRVWSPQDLERLARTYWRFLSRATAYVVSVRYSATRRQIVALGLFPLLTFQAPEYVIDGRRGIVRWRIDRGILVSRAGRRGRGYLEIDVRRHPTEPDGTVLAHVRVEVANFYPAIASGFGQRFYIATQSRIHVIITNRFLRSLARLDLAESRVGRFSASET
jgi:hypothetical protein